MIEDKIIQGKLTLGKTGMYISAETEKGYDVNFHILNIPELSTVGVNNMTEDRQFILFMDYDNIKEEDLLKELDHLGSKYSISHFLMLMTGTNKFHVISFEKFDLPTIILILKDSLSDYSYKATGVAIKLDKGWILRLKPKIDYDGNIVRDRPEYHGFLYVYDRYEGRQISRAHLELFAKLYPQVKEKWEELEKFIKFHIDEYSTVRFIKYGTSHKNFLMNTGLGDLIESKKLTVVWTVDGVDWNG